MTWLYEQPLIIVVLGVALIFGLGVGWSASGRKELLYALGAALALLIGALVIERMVVTDREAIRATLQQIANDVKSNNRAAVKSHVHSSAPELKAKADAEMPNYQFTDCRITKIHLIEVDDHAEPRSGVVEFNVIASGSFKQGGIEVADANVPRWVKLHLLREKDGRWGVVEYDHAPPQQMLFNEKMNQ
jgi:hypothetical protein